MKKLRALLALMALAILIIVGFQLYWLRDNYHREQESLQAKTDIIFRETVRTLQDSLIQAALQKISISPNDTTPPKAINITRRPNAAPSPQAARVINLLGQRLRSDTSFKKDSNRQVMLAFSDNPDTKHFVRDSAGKISLKLHQLPASQLKQVIVFRSDSINRDSLVRDLATPGFNKTERVVHHRQRRPASANPIVQINSLSYTDDKGATIMIQVDSLFNDTLPPSLLRATLIRNFTAEMVNVPFTIAGNPIRHKDLTAGRTAFTFNYEPYLLRLGDARSFLFKKIQLPILFSILLVGITVLSFILLYRSLVKQYRLGVMKNNLISNISHELKTPIATVGVALEALKNFNAIDDPSRSREYLDISQNELHRLNLLVDKVLKLSMFEKKQVELRKEQVNLHELAQEIVGSMRLQAEKAGATIRLQIEGSASTILADRLHISSVLFNLLDNAIKYSQEKPMVDVMVRSHPADGMVELSVSDNGIGIPPAYAKKVFDKFFRVPMGDQHNAKGYGLGLSYVAEVIRQHRGAIELQSEVGTGTRFIVLLPMSIKE